MTGFEHGRMGGHALPNDAPPFTTLVHLTWEEGRIEHRIRFGRPIYQRTIDRRSRVVGFAPHSIFAFVPIFPIVSSIYSTKTCGASDDTFSIFFK